MSLTKEFEQVGFIAVYTRRKSIQLLGSSAPATTCLCTPFPHLALVVSFSVSFKYLSHTKSTHDVFRNFEELYGMKIRNEDSKWEFSKSIGILAFAWLQLHQELCKM